MTVLNHKRKYIFIRNSKTGSRSIRDILIETANGEILEGREGHLLPGMIIRILGIDCWNEYFKFTFVRNPWDHLVSNWILLQRLNRIPSGITLREYAFDYRKPGVDDYSIFFMHEGRLCVNYIGKMETIQKDYDAIASILSLPRATVPHVKSRFRRNKDYRVYYGDDVELIERVRAIYKPEVIRYLGYEYGQ